MSAPRRKLPLIKRGEPLRVARMVPEVIVKMVVTIGPKKQHPMIKGCFFREVTFDDGEVRRYNANQFADTDLP